MPDENLQFKIVQKNNTEDKAVSNPLQAIYIPFRFHRYLYIDQADLENSLDSVEINGSVFNFNNVTTKPLDHNGFLYIYYEKKAEKDEFDYVYGSECQISVYSSENKQYNTSSYARIHPKSGNEINELKWVSECPLPHINFNKGDIVWIAYSEVRWSHRFRERIMNDFESVQKRFQKLEVNSFVDGCKIANIRKDFFLPNHYGTWAREPKNYDKYNIIYGYEKQDGLNIYTFNVAAATLFVDDMCEYVQKYNDEYRRYINNLVSGIDPSNENSRYHDPVTYQNLFISASSLYPILLSYPKSSKGRTPVLDIVQEDKFKILLDLDNRRTKKEYILDVQRRTLHVIFFSSWFKNSLLEYLDNRAVNITEGQRRLLDFYEILRVDPFSSDMSIFSQELYDLQKKGSGYNPTIDNDVIKYTTEHYFFKNNEEEEYGKLTPSTLKYTDFESKYDIIKLLLNTVVEEKALYDNLKPSITLPDIYNAATILYEDENAILPSDLNSAAGIALKTTVFIDSFLWYFSIFVTTDSSIRQLERRYKSINKLINALTETRSTDSFNLSKGLASLIEVHDENIAYYKKIEQENKEKIEKTKANEAKRKENLENRKTRNKEIRKGNKGKKLDNVIKDHKQSELDLKQSEQLKKDEVKAFKDRRNKILKRYSDRINLKRGERGDIWLKRERHLNTKGKTAEGIIASPLWTHFMFSFSLAGVMSSIYVNYSDTSNSTARKIGNASSFASAITQVTAVMVDVYFDKNKEAWIKIVEKFNLKNAAFKAGVRVGIASTIMQALSDMVFATSNTLKGNDKAAACYLASATAATAASGMLVAVAVATRAGSAVPSPAPWVAATLFGISVLAGMAAPYFEYNEFEDFLSASPFSQGGNLDAIIPFQKNKKLDTEKFNTSFKLGSELCRYPKSYSSDNYTGLGLSSVDMQNYNTVLDIVRMLNVPFKVLLEGKAEEVEPTLGGEARLMQYTKFRISLQYFGSIFIDEELEYKAELYGLTSDGNINSLGEIKQFAFNEPSLSEDFEKLSSREASIKEEIENYNKNKFIMSEYRLSGEDKDIDFVDFIGSKATSFEVPLLSPKLQEKRKYYLMVLVRIKSLDGDFVEGVNNNYFPSKQNGEDCYFGLCINLHEEVFGRNHNPVNFRTQLQPKTIREFIKNIK